MHFKRRKRAELSFLFLCGSGRLNDYHNDGNYWHNEADITIDQKREYT